MVMLGTYGGVNVWLIVFFKVLVVETTRVFVVEGNSREKLDDRVLVVVLLVVGNMETVKLIV